MGVLLVCSSVTFIRSSGLLSSMNPRYLQSKEKSSLKQIVWLFDRLPIIQIITYVSKNQYPKNSQGSHFMFRNQPWANQVLASPGVKHCRKINPRQKETHCNNDSTDRRNRHFESRFTELDLTVLNTVSALYCSEQIIHFVLSDCFALCHRTNVLVGSAL